MRRSYFSWLPIFGSLMLISMVGQARDARAQGGQVSSSLFRSEVFQDATGHTLPYRLFIPKNYDPARKYPLVLFLHGVGESGTDNTKQIDAWHNMAQLFALSENQALHPAFVLAPQCPVEVHWVSVPFSQGTYNQSKTPLSSPLRSVVGLLDRMSRDYSIDPDRLYVAGLSMGGYGAWDLITRFPDRFAAAIIACGGGDATRAADLKNMGIWAFHDADDPVVPVEGSRTMIAALRAVGGAPGYSEAATGGHSAWFRVYDVPGIANWLFSHRKNGVSGIVPRPERNTLFGDELAHSLTATSGDGFVRLHWEPIIGAAVYTVERTVLPHGAVQTITAAIVATDETDPGLTNGTTYSYTVTALNAIGQRLGAGQIQTMPTAAFSPLK